MSILHLGSWRGSSSTETAFKRLRDPVRDKDYQAPRRDQFPSQEAGSTLGINKATILLCASVFLMGQMLNLASSPAFQHAITNKTQTLGMMEWNAGGWPLYFQACGLTVWFQDEQKLPRAISHGGCGLNSMITAHPPFVSSGGNYAVLMKGKRIGSNMWCPEEMSLEVKYKCLPSFTDSGSVFCLQVTKS